MNQRDISNSKWYNSKRDTHCHSSSDNTEIDWAWFYVPTNIV